MLNETPFSILESQQISFPCRTRTNDTGVFQFLVVMWEKSNDQIFIFKLKRGCSDSISLIKESTNPNIPMPNGTITRFSGEELRFMKQTFNCVVDCRPLVQCRGTNRLASAHYICEVMVERGDRVDHHASTHQSIRRPWFNRKSRRDEGHGVQGVVRHCCGQSGRSRWDLGWQGEAERMKKLRQNAYCVEKFWASWE